MSQHESPTSEPNSKRSLPTVALEITRGRARQKRRAVHSAAFLIGSAPDSDLVLGDDRFDALHSYLYLSQERVVIRRVSAGPVLSVEDRPVSSSALEDADHVQLGPYEFRVQIDWPQSQLERERVPRALLGQMDDTIDNDRALERLLRDIEGLSPAPPIGVYRGANESRDQCVAHGPPNRAEIARAFSRKAGT